MRPPTLILALAASLAVNGLLWRTHREHLQAEARSNQGLVINARLTPEELGNQSAPSSELKDLVTKLRSSNLPPPLIRIWVKSAVNAQFASREQALAMPPRQHFWNADPAIPLATKFARIDLEADKSRLLDDLVGYDPALPENAGYSFLPLEKQRAVKNVYDPYSAKLKALTDATSFLPTVSMATDSERAEISRMTGEMNDKLAQWLTPFERLQVDARTTLARTPVPAFDANGTDVSLLHNGWYQPASAAVTLRRELRYFDATEEEFVTIYGITKAMNERHLYEMGSTNLQRQEITMAAQAALGPERGTAYAQSSDRAFADAADYVIRSGLPLSTARDALSLRTQIGADSAQIGKDPNLTTDQKLEALTALADQGWSDFENLLGPTVAAGARPMMNLILQNLRRGMYQIPASDLPPGIIGTGFRAVPQ